MFLLAEFPLNIQIHLGNVRISFIILFVIFAGHVKGPDGRKLLLEKALLPFQRQAHLIPGLMYLLPVEKAQYTDADYQKRNQQNDVVCDHKPDILFSFVFHNAKPTCLPCFLSGSQTGLLLSIYYTENLNPKPSLTLEQYLFMLKNTGQSGQQCHCYYSRPRGRSW